MRIVVEFREFIWKAEKTFGVEEGSQNRLIQEISRGFTC